MRWDTLKQQELDLKLRIKVLKKQLVEPNRSHDQYEEIQTTLDVVLDEYQDLLMKKFKKSLGRWIQSFREENILVRTVDCMFAGLEKDDQDAVARKWYKSIVDFKDASFYKQMAENRKLEVESWKKKNKEQRKIYRENIKQWKEWSKHQKIPSEVKKIAESPIIQANKHGVDITRDMKIKEIVDIMQARYDSLNEKYNQCKIKYTETFVEMNNKLVELQKDKKDVES